MNYNKQTLITRTISFITRFLLFSLLITGGKAYAASCLSDTATGNISPNILSGNNSVSLFFDIDASETAGTIWFRPMSNGTVTLTHINAEFDSVANLFEDSNGQLNDLQNIASDDDGVATTTNFRIEDVAVVADTLYCVEITQFGGQSGPFDGVVELALDEPEIVINTEFPECTSSSVVAGYFVDTLAIPLVTTDALSTFTSIGKIEVLTAGELRLGGAEEFTGGSSDEVVSVTLIPEDNQNTRIEIPRDQSENELGPATYCAYVEVDETDALNSNQLEVDLIYIPDADIYNSLEVIWGDDAQFAENAGVIELGVRHSEPVEREILFNIEVSASTATQDLDFELNELSSVIPVGESEGKLSIQLVDDSVEELDEQVQIRLFDRRGGLFTTTTLTIIDDDTPSAVNQAPQFSSANFPQTAEVGELYSFNAIATDLDGDEITYRLENQPDWLSIEPSNGLVSGTPTANDVEITTSIRIIAMDRSGDEDTVEFNLTVLDVPTEEPTTDESTMVDGNSDSANNRSGGSGCSISSYKNGAKDPLLLFLGLYVVAFLYRNGRRKCKQ